MTNGKTEYVYLWTIENYSFFWYNYGDDLKSPPFTIEGVEGTNWFLVLYSCENKDVAVWDMSLFIDRKTIHGTPQEVSLKFELSLKNANGLFVKSSKFETIFQIDDGYGSFHFAKLDEILSQRSLHIPHDTLTVRCRIWKGTGKVLKVSRICARTCIRIEKVSFLHSVENFSTLPPSQANTVYVRSDSRAGSVVSSNLYFTNDSCSEGKIFLEIIPLDSNNILCKRKISLQLTSGSLTEDSIAHSRIGTETKCIQKLPLSLTKKDILNEKCKYLLDDKLSLICECTFSTGLKFEEIKETCYELPSVVIDQIVKENNQDLPDIFKKLLASPNIHNDLQTIYNEQYLSDVVVKTKTKSFPAHKIVLSARSSVFRTMLDNNMKEKITGSIQIDDLEDDVVQQFLLYFYSDNFENLRWNDALRLYYAADKYQVEHMKLKCSLFLQDTLTVSNVSEVLLLADTHNDCDLKKIAEEFILSHEEDVYCLSKWKELMETNPLLCLKTMYLKYTR